MLLFSLGTNITLNSPITLLGQDKNNKLYSK